MWRGEHKVDESFSATSIFASHLIFSVLYIAYSTKQNVLILTKVLLDHPKNVLL